MAREAIFISYRREDSAKDAAALYEALVARVGPSHIFKDVDNIPLGKDFGEHIRGILPNCRIVLVLIGPRWVGVTDQDGRRRLEDPYDWVRIEVELALGTAGLRVVPVLVGGARMPHADDLPPSLHLLLRRNAATLRPAGDYDTDIDRLFNSLEFVLLPEMVSIPAGEYIMGSPESENARSRTEGPQHLVRIEPFELGKYPVTFAEWDAANASGAGFLSEERRRRLPQLRDDEGFGRDRRPVINADWHDAHAYIVWLNNKTSGGYRLPSEAEWEYACRAGSTTSYSTGESISLSQARFRSTSTAPVGSYSPNAFGLHDMHGNIWEWCEDNWHDGYDGAPNDGSAWVSSRGDHVLRGGSWCSHPEVLRSAARVSDFALDRGYNGNKVGFRVARTL